MARWNRALVTGASSGIGETIARQLAADGTSLVVVARDSARLEKLAAELSVDVEVLTADLADRAAVVRVAERIASDDQPIDLVVNNAGLGYSGRFSDLDYERERNVLDVNVTALHELSHAAAVALTRRGGGGILNIASVAGYYPTAGNATYAATKAFVNSFSESLHQDLKAAGVAVTASCPGFTHTEFHDRADIDKSTIQKFLWHDSDRVAKQALEAVGKNKARVIPGLLYNTLVGLLKVLPLRVTRGFASRSTELD